MSGSLGAQRLQEIASSLELMGDTTDVERCVELVAAADSEFLRLRDYLNKLDGTP
jgi:HPt (histidine-containing phosphotransfer) domain-containing protein